MERHELEEGKKNSARLGAYLSFIDESGFMLTPTVRRTWAPVGYTPLIRHYFANNRLSVISGISINPIRKRLGLFGMFFWNNIAQEEVVLFLREVLRHLRVPVSALWDNNNTHKGVPLHDLCRRFPRLHLVYFPAYAPELNPDEAVWGLLKSKLANGRANDLEDLADQTQNEFRHLARSQTKLRGCVRQSGLSFSFPSAKGRLASRMPRHAPGPEPSHISKSWIAEAPDRGERLPDVEPFAWLVAREDGPGRDRSDPHEPRGQRSRRNP